MTSQRIDSSPDVSTTPQSLHKDPWYKWIWAWKSYLIIVLTPIVFCPLILTDKLPQKEMRAAYAIIILAVYWVMEVCPFSVTAFLPLVLFPGLGVMNANQTSMPYFRETNVLIVGGFIVAVAIEHVKLHKRLALKVILLVGVQPRRLMLSFMVTTAFLSMWSCNAATTAMMLPIATAVLEEIKQRENSAISSDTMNGTPNSDAVKHNDLKMNIITPLNEQTTYDHEIEAAETDEILSRTSQTSETDKATLMFSKGLVLGVAYAANIGGTGTLIGTATNIIFQGQVESLFPECPGIGFAEWIFFAFPVTVTLTLIAWLLLQWQYIGLGKKQLFWLCNLCKCKNRQHDRTSEHHGNIAKTVIQREYDALGPMTFAEKVVLVHFVILVILWLTRHPMFVPGWDTAFLPKYVKDSQAAIFIAVLLFIMPSQMPTFSGIRAKGPPPPILTWEIMSRRFPWNIIILLGSGFAIAEASKVSGLSRLLGLQLQKLNFIPTYAIVLLCCTIITGFTEVASNAATATIFLPILAELVSH